MNLELKAKEELFFDLYHIDKQDLVSATIKLLLKIDKLEKRVEVLENRTARMVRLK